MSLLNPRIRGRLYGGFGALVLLGSSIAGYAVWQLSQIQHEVGEMTRGSASVLRNAEVATDLQSYRRNILRYIFDQDGASLTDAEKLEEKITATVRGAAVTTKSEQRRDAYKEMDKVLGELKVKRSALGNAVKAAAGGRVALLAEGDTMMADTDRLLATARDTSVSPGAVATETALLRLRLTSWRFMSSRDPKEAVRFKGQASEAERRIAELGQENLPADAAAALGTIKADVTRYASLFETTATNLLLGDELFYKSIAPLTVSAVAKIGEVNASLGTEFNSSTTVTNGRITDTINLQEIVSGAVSLLGLMIAFVIGRGITRPLAGLTAGMKELAKGNFGFVLPGLQRRDEIGEMARSVEEFKVRAEEKASRDAALEHLQRQTTEREKIKALQAMAETVEREANAAVGEVSGETERMAGNAVRMTESAVTLGENSSSVAAAAEEALANAQTLTKASVLLNASISEIAAQVSSSRALTVEAVAASNKAQATIGKLSEAANKVGAVTNLISEIASQTNLLALNATIEAARAGEAGRGFAVVAQEVKSLAEQTAKATSEIAQQITEIQSATQDSVASISAIGEVIRNVEGLSSTISVAMDKQSSVTREISRTVEESSHAAKEVATQIISVSTEAIETGRRASEIRDGSVEIAAKVDHLRAIMVRVVRTSTADVDRRTSRRLEIDAPAMLQLGDRSCKVALRNLSLDGAMIGGAMPDAVANAPVSLVIDGISARLDGVVVQKDKDMMRIRFNLSPAAAKAVEDMIDRRRAA